MDDMLLEVTALETLDSSTPTPQGHTLAGDSGLTHELAATFQRLAYSAPLMPLDPALKNRLLQRIDVSTTAKAYIEHQFLETAIQESIPHVD